jgi:hypothetical protein
LGSLFRSFNKLHDEKSKLTVGARALSKHAKRSSEKFWGIDKVLSHYNEQHNSKTKAKFFSRNFIKLFLFSWKKRVLAEKKISTLKKF